MTARTANIIEFLFNKNISLFSKTRNLGERIIADYKHNTWQENDSKKFLRYALSSPFAQPKTKMKRSVSFVIKRCVLNPYLSFILGEKFSVRNIFLDRESKGKSKTTNYLHLHCDRQISSNCLCRQFHPFPLLESRVQTGIMHTFPTKRIEEFKTTPQYRVKTSLTWKYSDFLSSLLCTMCD